MACLKCECPDLISGPMGFVTCSSCFFTEQLINDYPSEPDPLLELQEKFNDLQSQYNTQVELNRTMIESMGNKESEEIVEWHRSINKELTETNKSLEEKIKQLGDKVTALEKANVEASDMIRNLSINTIKLNDVVYQHKG